MALLKNVIQRYVSEPF